MRIIQTKSFVKTSSDLKRQPSTFPGENDSGQISAIIPKRRCRKHKTKKVYQLGINTPILESDLDISQRPHLGML